VAREPSLLAARPPPARAGTYARRRADSGGFVPVPTHALLRLSASASACLQASSASGGCCQCHLIRVRSRLSRNATAELAPRPGPRPVARAPINRPRRDAAVRAPPPPGQNVAKPGRVLSLPNTPRRVLISAPVLCCMMPSSRPSRAPARHVATIARLIGSHALALSVPASDAQSPSA
jgi:hypothetical protein